MRIAKALNRPVVFLAVFVLFLAVDGLLLYNHYQSSLQRDSYAGNTPPNSETDTASTEEPATPVEQGPTTAEETGSEESVSDETASGESASQETAAFEEATAFASEEAGELQVVVRVVDAPTYLTIQEDGLLVLDQESQPGFSMQFGANREVDVSTGDAGATWVEVNGYELEPLGPSGESATRTFTVGL